MTDQPVPP
jgi:polo-like kinase 1